MATNPYESPEAKSCEALSNQASQKESVGLLQWGVDLTFAAIATLLVVSAICHWAQLGDLETYRESLWIGVELLTMVISIFAVPAHLLRVVYYLFQKRFKYAAVAMGSIMFAIVATGLAFWIDAPTLLYMT